MKSVYPRVFHGSFLLVNILVLTTDLFWLQKYFLTMT
jgi:hypothetical protein